MAPSASVFKLLCLLLLAVLPLVRGQLTCPASPEVCNVYPQDYAKPIPTCGSQGSVNAARARSALLVGPCFASYAACRDSCLANTACQSFAVDPRLRACALYSKNLAGIGFAKNSSSPQRFYNRNCFSFQSCMFKLVVADDTAEVNGAPLVTRDDEGRYVNAILINVPSDNWDRAPALFKLDGDKLVESHGRTAYATTDGTTTPEPYIFVDRNTSTPDASDILHCTNGAGGKLSCHTTTGLNQFTRCLDNNSNILRIFPTSNPPAASLECSTLSLKVVAAT